MLVVLGAGQAAARLVEHLRAGGYNEPITLVGDETELPYERPALSKSVLTGDQHPSSLQIHNASFYEQAGVRVLLGERCSLLDVRRKEVVLASGTSLPYNSCVLALGASPRMLSEHAAVPSLQYLRSMDDASRLAPLLTPGRRLLVIGGGFLGLEAASSARRLGLDVTVVHAAPTLLNRVLPPELGRELRQLHESQGVQIIVDSAVTKLTRKEACHAYTAEFQNGGRHLADVVLVSVGSVANDELARLAGLECDNGVLCDEHCRTSEPGVWAIGDCARVVNLFEGKATRYESWQAAELHAKTAAASILGSSSAFDEVPWFWSDQAGVNLQILGAMHEEGSLHTRQLSAAKPGRITFSVNANGVLQGAALFNAGKFRRALRDLIASRQSVDISALSDATVSIPDLALPAVLPLD